MRKSTRSPGDPDVDDVRHSSVAAAFRAPAHDTPGASLTGLLGQRLRPNVLVIGPVARSEATVAAIVDALATPVRYWNSEVPPPAPDDGTTTVIRDVATLSLPLQEAWLAWLTQHAHHAQVIATSSIAVFPLVTRGIFLEELYYRLNTVLLDVRRSSQPE